MKIDASLGVAQADLSAVAGVAERAERLGFDAVLSSETVNDPFLPLVVATGATERIQVGTAIAVAFARNPMSMAVAANDLQVASEGRLLLGLGSQVKAHIMRRFSMPWSKPVERMREYVLALQAIWECWNEGSRLGFEGDFYTHTLMTPYFRPPPHSFGPPEVLLAAVGARMTEVAGEVADGVITHAFTTDRYLREVTIPALEQGLARSGRQRADVEVSRPVFVVTGHDEAEMAKSDAAVRGQIAFYASTPEYRGVLELHGWSDLQTELQALAREGEWKAMASKVDDEVLRAFAVVAEPADVVAQVRSRFEGLADRVSLFDPLRPDPDDWAAVLQGASTT